MLILDASRLEPWELFYPVALWHEGTDRDIQNTPIVYKLFRDSALVYVGKTRASLRARVRGHLADKKLFDSELEITFYDTKREMDYFEQLLVRKYRPEYNAVLYDNSYSFDLRKRRF